MLKAEILSCLPSLKPEDLDEIQIAIGKLRDTAWLDPTLSDGDKAALQEALDDLARNPKDGVSWETLKAELDAEFKR